MALARSQTLEAKRAGPRRAALLTRLDQTRRILADAHKQLSNAAEREVDVGPAAAWVLDNYYVVQEHMREVRESLPSGYYRELPRLSAGPLAGYPRVYELAITLISHTEARVDLDNVDLFVEAFQRVRPLSIGELWAVPAMLRLALIESVRRMTLRTLDRLNQIEDADRRGADLVDARDRADAGATAAIQDLVDNPPQLTPTFVARLLYNVRESGVGHPSLVDLEDLLGREAERGEAASTRSTQLAAITQIIIANSITSMRAIARLDWKVFVEHQSALDRELRKDPSRDYVRMTFATRDHYRHVVERISKQSGLPEADVAARAIALANQAAKGSYRRHVGFFLIDDGVRELENACVCTPRLSERTRRALLRQPNATFAAALIATTAAIIVPVFSLITPLAWITVLLITAVLLVPAFDVAVGIVNQVLSVLLRPRLLPKLALDGPDGVPAQFRTAVVVPTLFGDVDSVREALESIEAQFLANRDDCLHFAVLSDFTDASSEVRDDDSAIVEAATAGIAELNERYAPHSRDAFFLFHRPRRWNAGEGVWMGWERKRGKLVEFNEFIRGGAKAAFSHVVGETGVLASVRYVITLDADTVLPPDSARVLIGAIAHPLNRPVFDASETRLLRGFTILQPRVGVSLPSAHSSRFAAINSGQPGVDPYTTAVSDVYQDLFGEGSFTGKGIYDVDAFIRTTEGRFPENRLLSHDLIEGNFARAGLASDILLYDDYPARYLTYTRRKHRWIRGDWQLLQWLTPTIPAREGTQRNSLSLLSRWKIFDNLRRSLVEAGQFLLLVAAWTVLPGSVVLWTMVAVLAIAAPWLTSLILAAVRPPRDKSWLAYYSAVGRDLRTSVKQVVLTIAFLPHQVFISLDAICRTLWRNYVSKQHLLEWQTASSAEAAVSTTRQATVRAMLPGTALGLAALGATIVAVMGARSVVALAATAPFFLLWMAAPVLADILSRPPARKSRELSPRQREQATHYAQLHWRYFDKFVTAETNHLVPDNFQEDPAPVVALRTSPTNIGLQLMATVTAHDLGFITIEDMTSRLEATFKTLAQLDRYCGHFYNWYDIRDLRVLDPAYVSTVDSGNLAGHLLAMRHAVRDAANAVQDDDIASRLYDLSDQAYTIAMEMDFSFLYDATRKLFAIGYHPESHSRDASYYDLLASEARLASFIAIAKNDVPVEHWFHLGRTLTHAGGATALLSWSGSMFEYLMPALVMRTWPLTLLDQTYHGAVHRQIAHGTKRGVPWGESESAYAVRDRHFTYQYRAFGVSDLGLKRGLERDLVVAPYASALAVMVDPRRALANMSVLEKKGALGKYGFYDALDYTRPAVGERFAVVRTYMAHHVGMSLVSLGNSLTADIWHGRFHTEPMVRATQLLLHERIPRRLMLQSANESHSLEVMPEQPAERPVVREFESPNTPHPHIALLGQLPYTIMISHCGAGYSRFENLAVTRWRSDATSDNMGQFCYVKDVANDRVWSVAHQPVCAPADWYRTTFAADRVTFQRADGNIETRTEIAIVPEDSAEVRRVTVTNNSNHPQEVELTSYGEVVLAPPEAERAHPAFANLFVETEFHAWCNAITATRRPRAKHEHSLVCVHVVATGPEQVGEVTCETNRTRFIGRGRTSRDPIALDIDGALSGTTGAVLDPVLALRTRVSLRPGQSASVAFTTLVAPTRTRAFELADRYRTLHTAQRALDLAWTTAQVELRELRLTSADASVFQELAGHLLYAGDAIGPSAAEREAGNGMQPLLWSIGVSGDRPILLATIESAAGLPTLREIFSAHHYWRRRGLHVDLVVLNEQPSTYLHELDDAVSAALATSTDAGVLDQPGGVFLRRSDVIPADVARLLRGVARVRIACDGQSLGQTLEASSPRVKHPSVAHKDSPTRIAERQEVRTSYAGRRARSAAALAENAEQGTAVLMRRSEVAHPDSSRDAPLRFDNGFGGLGDNDDYHVRVRGDFMPPAPWSNVIANPHGGFLITERGAGYTWAGNSYFYRLTPWYNDPVSDPAGDALYLQDEESGEIWSPTPAPAGGVASYSIKHSPGSSTFEHTNTDIHSVLTMGMADDSAVRLSKLALTNTGAKPRTLRLTAYAEWTLGVLREQTQHHLRTSFCGDDHAIYARNEFDPQFADWVSFLAVSEPIVAHTADRREFIGRNGTLSQPLALRSNALAGATGVGLDPCAALQCLVTLQPGETREVTILLGAGETESAATELVRRYSDIGASRVALDNAVQTWTDRLARISVRTPDPAFNAMINQWSLYQALACRMWARTGFYQSSGAYGFRDQLQDVMAFVYAEPAVAREHILRAASRQFTEGDVQHWWHPQSGRGVRTRFSDDLVWLVYVTDHYTRVTGDFTILDEQAPFLSMRELLPDEHEVYDQPSITEETATLYEHCRRALERACTRGAHGLPLIGTGDWNDGMNRVGAEGRGESVWLAWFLIASLRKFAVTARLRSDEATAATVLERADQYSAAVEASAWDGAWYRRAYYDDGTPIGSAESDECKIDAIAQSWSIISGSGMAERQARAMESVEEHLVDDDARIIRLLTPAFDKTDHDPGYIRGYLPGVRENGAQYTHAALWTVLATALQGRHDRAFELLQMINPLTRAASAEDAQRYKVEPYTIAADVYTAAAQLGRGGWTWYTGSASWFYRIGLETILGFVKEGETLRIMPCVPVAWPEYGITYRYGSATYEIAVTQTYPAGEWVTSVDSVPVADGVIQLVDDGALHKVVVESKARREVESRA